MDPLRQSIVTHKHCDEHDFISAMIASPALPPEQRQTTLQLARELVAACRADTDNQSLLDSFLLEFGLSNKEGVALMCLAEALLRVPDHTNIDRLIAEKISSGDWQDHSGKSSSAFVNAATWGMILTGKVVQLDAEITEQPGSWIKSLTSNLSEPLVRTAVMQAMKIMGGQYVLGRSIEEGFKRAQRSTNNARIRYSFDMLGEAARTEKDAQRYFESYRDALEKIGAHSAAARTGQHVADADGISVKLSALHPRYEVAQKERVNTELYPRIKALCVMAKQHNIGLSIDAEEASRLEMSLDLFERLCQEPELDEWEGLGFVLQAYQKRAPSVARWLIDLAERSNRTLMVRLVKGAYWDAEIKHAQEQGLVDYPVFTVKAHTDACYMACAKLLLGAGTRIYPQFATHNAQTVAALIQLSQLLDNPEFEFQRLHGMGDLLYHHLNLRPEGAEQSVRIYAPIGKHEDLLPYLVRRLLENGANSSFVNRFLDDDTPLDELVKDVIDDIASQTPHRHPRIPLPRDLFLNETLPRQNAQGWDLDDDAVLQQLLSVIDTQRANTLTAHTLVNGTPSEGPSAPIHSPNQQGDAQGTMTLASDAAIEEALASAKAHQAEWYTLGAEGRGQILEQWADALETNTPEIISIISQEAGRTLADCVDEVREAVDFCRYYANQARDERYRSAQPLGTVVCISPWNFPLAIFVGPISAALAAGNCVIAKPAEQTPTVATRAIEYLLSTDIPNGVIHCLQGEGAEIGKRLLSDARIDGVAFTGSTTTAQAIHRTVCERPQGGVPLLAETGGQNAMIVDSTALPEQVVDDVIRSAFHSAGQRCSALRLLIVQEEVADKLLDMLKAACDSVYVGDSRHHATDIGPIIDVEARAALDGHIEAMQARGARIHRVAMNDALREQGVFFAPAIIELDMASVLTKEVFGPIVHVVRYRADQLDRVIDEINQTGYGLTLGVHSRIEAFANTVFKRTGVGNTYINRNIIGAVVGVNPFGGSGLSGTGPKAGGPWYLSRFLSTTTPAAESITPDFIEKIINQALSPQLMPGPTGEENLLSTHPAGRVAILGSINDASVKTLVELALCLGNEVECIDTNDAALMLFKEQLEANLDATDVTRLTSTSLNEVLESPPSVVLAAEGHPQKGEIQRQLAASDGPIVQTIAYPAHLSAETVVALLPHLMEERTKTDNLIARGGNTQLFNL